MTVRLMAAGLLLCSTAGIAQQQKTPLKEFVVQSSAVPAAIAPVKSKVPRGSVDKLERTFDTKVLSAKAVDPLALLGPTRGVYLDGYGIVFQTEVNLVANAVMSPFKPEYSRVELNALREKKFERIGLLKEKMQEMMSVSADELKTLPPEELIVVAVNVFYFSWEDAAGAPTQVVMQAPRKALMEANSGKPDVLQSALLVKCY